MAQKSNISQIATRYATSLLNAAGDNAIKIGDEFASLQQKISEGDKNNLLSSKIISADDKISAINAISKSAGADSLLSSFFTELANAGRLNILCAINYKYQELLLEKTNSVRVEVTSASELSDEQQSSLSTEIEKKLGKKIVINSSIDKSLIGGLKIKIGSLLLDDTVAGKLRNLENILSN